MPLSSSFKLGKFNLRKVEFRTMPVVLGKTLLCLNQLNFLELLMNSVVHVTESSVPSFLCINLTDG